MKKRFILRGKPYEVDKEDIIKVLKKINIQSDIRKYYIEHNGVEYSIKQVIKESLNIPSIDITSKDAYLILKKLGFEIKEKY